LKTLQGQSATVTIEIENYARTICNCYNKYNNTVQASTVQANTVQANTVQANIVQADTVQANIIQANIVQTNICSTMFEPQV